eukprot:5861583-Pyramimonas_sp.AAC.1
MPRAEVSRSRASTSPAAWWTQTSGEIKVIARNAQRAQVVEQGHRIARLILDRCSDDPEIMIGPR